MNLFDRIRRDQEQVHDKKNKRKARRYAIFYMILLLIMLIFPFINRQLAEEPELAGILIDFSEEFTQSASTKKSSSRPSAAAAEEVESTTDETETVEEVEEEVQPEEVKQPPKVEKPVKEVAEVKPITPPAEPLLTSEDESVVLKDFLEKVDIPEDAQVTQVSSEIVEVTEGATEEFIADIASFFKNSSKKPAKNSSSSSSSKSNSSGSGDSADSGTGDSGTAGEGDSGTSEDGDADTDGNGNDGNSGDDFDGDGLLTRKVIYRANLNDIMKKSGKIVINLCVNRDGKVIFSEIDKRKSTIRDASILRRAERAAAKYRYEKDYTVAERQCGKLTFIVKIQK